MQLFKRHFWIRDDNIKIAKYLEESDILIKCVSETIKNLGKKQKSRFLGMLLGALVASLLGNMLAGKGVFKTCEGVIGAGEKVIRAVQSLKIHRQTKNYNNCL